MLPEEHGFLERGMRVLIGPELRGNELYGMDDPEDYLDYLCKEGVVEKVYEAHGDPTWFVDVMMDDCGDLVKKNFIIEEIQCICGCESEQLDDIDMDDFNALLVFADDSEEMITSA